MARIFALLLAPLLSPIAGRSQDEAFAATFFEKLRSGQITDADFAMDDIEERRLGLTYTYSSAMDTCPTDLLASQTALQACVLTTTTTTTATVTATTSTVTATTTTTVTATTSTATTTTTTTSTETTSTSTATTTTATTTTATTLTTSTNTATTATTTVTTTTTETTTATTLDNATTTLTETTTTTTYIAVATTTATVTTTTTVTVTATTTTTGTTTATTTTTGTTTATTTTTVTVTATTTTVTTITQTVTTTTTTTTTATTLTATTSTETATTTTTVTTLDSCTMCPTIPVTDCSSIGPNQECVATVSDFCAETVSVAPNYTCSATVGQRPALLVSGSSHPKVTCQVCNAVAGTDMNPSMSSWSGDITFGPNMIGGVINETDVLGYRLRLVYASGLRVEESYLLLYNPDTGSSIGDSLVKTGDSVLGSVNSFKGDCCWREKYKVRLMNVALPSAAAYAMIYPYGANHTIASYGVKVELQDISYTTTETVTMTTVTATTTTFTNVGPTTTILELGSVTCPKSVMELVEHYPHDTSDFCPTTTTTTTGTTTTTTTTATTTVTTSTATTMTTTSTTATTSTSTVSTTTETTATSTSTLVATTTVTTTTGTTTTGTTVTTTTTTVTQTTMTMTTTTATTVTTVTVTTTDTTTTVTTTTVTTSTVTTTTGTTTTGTTVTTTTTTVTTTLAATTTVTTITSTTATTTTATTTTATVTGTTTTMTTTPYTCKPCTEPVFTLDNVPPTFSLAPGQYFQATKFNNSCIVGDSPMLSCSEQTGLMASRAYPKLVCMVCMKPTISPDQDNRQGMYTGTLRFGPNKVNDKNTQTGSVDEGMIESYKVYWVGSSVHGGPRVSPPVATVPRQATPATCCSQSYSVQISGAIPHGMEKLQVVPVMTGGWEAPVGDSTDRVIDDDKATMPPTPAPTPSPPPPPGPGVPVVEETRVSGSMDMSVADVQAFINDASVHTGIKNGLAQVTGVSAQYISVTLSAARRRLQGGGRFLAAGAVRVLYDIVVPASAGVQVTGSQIATSVSSTSTTQLATIVNQQVAQATGSSAYTVTVTSVSAPTVVVVTSMPTPAPAPPPTPPAPPAPPPAPPSGQVEGGAMHAAAPLAPLVLLALVAAVTGLP
mmetsp:Transcript_103636/g.275722  ORF Transcript_103636/g.275722 Transcript_103636/m.275722 type:complete len:1123 (-) Transcript_103636:108-3476(-)